MDFSYESFVDILRERIDEFSEQKQSELIEKVVEELKKNGYSDFTITDNTIILGENDMVLEYGDPNKGILPKGILRQMMFKKLL